jgi:uncharacterized protein YecT (DUF1311 family)
VVAQFDADAKRLAAMAYMEDRGPIDCDEIMSNREARICYNLKFQRADSILNAKLNDYLSTYSDNSLKEQFLSHHRAWIEYRRFQSEMYSKGNRGHFMGIRYLGAMTELSNLKIEELSLLMDEEEEE